MLCPSLSANQHTAVCSKLTPKLSKWPHTIAIIQQSLVGRETTNRLAVSITDLTRKVGHGTHYTLLKIHTPKPHGSDLTSIVSAFIIAFASKHIT